MHLLPDVRLLQTLRFQISNKCFIHSPAKKRPELYDQALAVSELIRIGVFRCGIIDKTAMREVEFWHEICRMCKVSTSFLQKYNHTKYCTIAIEIKEKN